MDLMNIYVSFLYHKLKFYFYLILSNKWISVNNETKESNFNFQSLKQWTIKTSRNIFRKKTFYNRVPLIKWLPKYTSEDAVGDLVAGLTVGLTVIPQALAYSGIAGLPPAVSFMYSNIKSSTFNIFLNFIL